jgi:hypothetical protein
MRRSLAFACLLALALPASASAHAQDGAVGAADTHGPDVASVVDRGPEVPAPAAGGFGKLKGSSPRYRLPTSWCGATRSTDNRENEFDNGPYRYHAIYAIPADGPDRFAAFANTLQADAFQASALLEQSYGRAIRFDLGTNCGAQYLDISVVRLPQTTAQLQALAPTGTGTLDAVSNGINAAGFPTIRPTDTLESASRRERNYVVWIDGPAPSGACGQATSYNDGTRDQSNLNNLAGKVAVVFPNGNGGFCSSNTVRHEIGHNLGALQPSAPHAFDGAHCNDAYEDTMCYSNSPRVTSGSQRGQFFDYGNDDYWDPPSGPGLPWWTANLNRFVCPDATCNVAGGEVIAAPDADGDGVVDGDDVCPTVADADQRDSNGDGEGDACSSNSIRTARKATVKVAARRAKQGWRVTLTARGEGKAVVSVRCRRTKRGAVKTVYSKSTKLPRTLRASVRCTSKPRAAVKQSPTV